MLQDATSSTHTAAHRGCHMICLMWTAECGYEELAGCLDHFCYRLGSGAARHALLTTSLPSSSQRCRLAELSPRLWYTSLFTALSFLNAVFESAQTTANGRSADFKVGLAGMDGRGREMYRKFDGASGDAYVTVLTHDRMQPPAPQYIRW